MSLPLSWFRSSAGHRYFLQLALIILIKLGSLVLLYYAFLKPAVRPDVSSVAIQYLLLDSVSSPPATHH